MWEMLLSFAASQRPACWAAVNMQKAFNPRLLAFLRHGCHGSAAGSLPALLPLMALLPRSVLGLQPVLLLDQVRGPQSHHRQGWRRPALLCEIAARRKLLLLLHNSI